MGRQIGIWAIKEDYEEMFDLFALHDIIVLNKQGNEVDKNSFKDYNQGGFKYYLTKNGFKLPYDKNRTGNWWDSEVIEFLPPVPSPAKTVDTSVVLNKFRTSSGIIVINRENEEEYHKLYDRCMKNPIYVNNPNYIKNGYEHGRLWYEPYFRDENFNKIPKCKELTSMYETLKRYIRKNYRISKNKFGYIGPYAYEEYLKGNYIPCSGKYRIEF